MNEEVKAEWKKLFPATLYPGRPMEERMVMALDHFDAVVIIYSFLGLVAIVRSVSGWFGLMSIHLQKRTKEIGIRKILGATIPHIFLKTSRLFLVIMFISFAFGGLLGAVMVNKLMDSVWEYYEAVDTKVFVLGVSILFAIASVTIYSIGAKRRQRIRRRLCDTSIDRLNQSNVRTAKRLAIQGQTLQQDGEYLSFEWMAWV